MKIKCTCKKTFNNLQEFNNHIINNVPPGHLSSESHQLTQTTIKALTIKNRELQNETLSKFFEYYKEEIKEILRKNPPKTC